MWEYNSTDELRHAKYIKRVRKNGKWQYTYDKEAVTKKVNKVSADAKEVSRKVKKYGVVNEADRAKDSVEYDLKLKKLKSQRKKKIKKIQKKWGKDDLANDLSKPFINAGHLAKVGRNRALKTMNKIGKGKADDVIVDTNKKIKKSIAKKKRKIKNR